MLISIAQVAGARGNVGFTAILRVARFPARQELVTSRRGRRYLRASGRSDRTGGARSPAGRVAERSRRHRAAQQTTKARNKPTLGSLSAAAAVDAATEDVTTQRSHIREEPVRREDTRPGPE